MYHVAVFKSNLERSDNHLDIEDENLLKFKSQRVNPYSLWKTFLPEEVRYMPEENLKELNESGKTTFTLVERTTVTISHHLHVEK